jgi:lipoprotein-anchoring transpeptidase ErfK/SrfK
VVVDPASRHLYFVDALDQATRYGVGVGRERFGWSGTAKINMRRRCASPVSCHDLSNP